MKRTFVLPLVLLASCSSPEVRRQIALMDRIESRVELPKGSFPMERYARYYAFDNRQRVIGTFITDVDTGNRHYDLPTGKRRWVDDYRNLPLIMDGGCSVVNVQYDPRTSKIDSSCNGVA